MKEYCVTVYTEFLVCADDEDDAMDKAFDLFVDKGYRGSMTATPTGVDYNDTDEAEDGK